MGTAEGVIRISQLSVTQTASLVPPGTHILGYVGSISHGTYIPPEEKSGVDDRDLLGVCVADARVYLGLEKFEQQVRDPIMMGIKWDVTVYEIRKFFRLLLRQNPNVLGLLWLRPQDYVHVSPIGAKILENRHLFVSKEAYHSFSGYAYGQLHRMTHFPKEHRGYMGAKRKELVEKYGYDCKNAAHLIRLLRMGIEYLTTGELRVFREDRDELKAIKKGEWSLEKIEAEAKKLFDLATEAFIRSPLPDKPHFAGAQDLLVGILRAHLALDFGPSPLERLS